VPCRPAQRLGQPSRAGADLQHEIVRLDACRRNQLVRNPLAAEEVLPVSAPAARVRGHGTSP
jgi:hypothetical protein